MASADDEDASDDDEDDNEMANDASDGDESGSDDAFGGASDMEMDEETRKELALLQAEDADFLKGMDELPTDESDLDSDEDLAAFDSDEDEEDGEEEDDEVMANTLRNQQAAQSDDESESEAEGDEEEEEASGSDDSSDNDADEEEEEPAAEEKLVVAEDIYGRPVIKAADGSKPTAYIPPHLRRKMQEEAAKAAAAGASARPSQMDEQAMRELARRLNGQLNRISEANMEYVERLVVRRVCLYRSSSYSCAPTGRSLSRSSASTASTRARS